MILRFLNLLDHQHRFSISNFCMYVMTIKTIIFQCEIYDAFVFLGLIANYCHRRYENRLAQASTQLDQRVITMDAQLRALSHDMLRFDEIAQRMNKQSDEVQKIITGKTFERAFNPTGRML